MNTPTISKLLDYVRVQMAAEALYDYDARKNSALTPGDTSSEKAINPDWLTTGNGHAYGHWGQRHLLSMISSSEC